MNQFSLAKPVDSLGHGVVVTVALAADRRLDSEDEMPAEELAALRSEIDSLEASLLETEMTPYLQGFIQRQIDAIRAALRIYRVQGMKPIEKALHQVVGAYTIEKSRVEAEHAQASEPAKTLLTRAGAIIKKDRRNRRRRRQDQQGRSRSLHTGCNRWAVAGHMGEVVKT